MVGMPQDNGLSHAKMDFRVRGWFGIRQRRLLLPIPLSRIGDLPAEIAGDRSLWRIGDRRTLREHHFDLPARRRPDRLIRPPIRTIGGRSTGCRIGRIEAGDARSQQFCVELRTEAERIGENAFHDPTHGTKSV